MKRPDCGSNVCMEKVEGCRAVLSVCFGFAEEHAVGETSERNLRG